MKNIVKIILLMFQFSIYAQTVVKVEKMAEKTYQVVTDKNLEANKTYQFVIVEKSLVEYKEIIITPPEIPIVPLPPKGDSQKPSCVNGDSFSITSVGYSKGQIDFQFNANNLSSGKYELWKDNAVIKTDAFTPSSNVVLIPTNDLSSGSYLLKIIGNSCNGTAQKDFSIDGSPVIETVKDNKNAGVSITIPNKKPYYFSDGHEPNYYNNKDNLPVIFTNQQKYDPINDLVWLKNDKIKIGINLKRGGQLAWASLVDATSNLVYNGYDGGFQVTIDAYQKKDGYTQDGEVAGSGIPDKPTFSYNVTQGGDFLNHAVSLINYHAIPNGYYVKLRPIHYPLTAKLSETYIEAWYTIDGYGVKCEYKYTSFRTDGQYEGNGFDGGHAPVCFLVNTLMRYKSYTGNSPWQHDTPEDGLIPNTTAGQSNFGKTLTKNSKEKWSLVYNPDNGVTVGIYAETPEGEGSFTIKQLEVYDGNGTSLGDEFTGGFTILGRNYDLVPFLSSFDRSNYSKTITSYLFITPNPQVCINAIYQLNAKF